MNQEMVSRYTLSMSKSQERGLLVVISGPSGVGKTTIVHRVRDAVDAIFSVSATTRPRSDSEKEGEDYYFVSIDQFENMLQSGAFLENAEVFGRHRYGTPKEPVEAALAAGQVMLLDIDVQGGIQVRRNMPGALMIFILPPSDEELHRRLQDRGRDDAEAIDRRYNEAKREIRLARQSGAYDHFIVNDDLDLAVREATAIIRQARSGQVA